MGQGVDSLVELATVVKLVAAQERARVSARAGVACKVGARGAASVGLIGRLAGREEYGIRW